MDPPKIFWHLKQPESNSTVIRAIIVKHNCFEDAWVLLLVGQPRVTQDNFRALSSPNKYCIFWQIKELLLHLLSLASMQASMGKQEIRAAWSA